MTDILVEIPNENLPKVAAMFENVKWAPHVSSLIQTGIQMKKTEKFCDCVCFMSPNNSWERDGTVVVLMTNFCYSIFVFTLDDGCINLYLGLTQTKILDYKNGKAFFFCVHEKHVPTIIRATEDLGLKVSKSVYTMYILPPQSSDFSTSIPDEVYVQKLPPQMAEKINTAWPYKFPDSEKFIETLLEINGGCGLFLESTNEMVAWILRYNFGFIGMLHTLEEWQRRGFGRVVTEMLVRQIVEEGYCPFATISADNFASIALFEKLGFEKRGQCAFFDVL